LVDKESILNHGGFEKYKTIDLDPLNPRTIDIFIERKFLEDLRRSEKVSVDLKTWKRFGRQMSSLSLKKGAIS
jgi:hypothetical protein